MNVTMQSDRLKHLPPYLFAELDRKKRELKAKGADVIDLSVGDPDLATPEHIVEALCEAAHDPKYHRYPPYNGTQEFREAAAAYLFHRVGEKGVKLDPDTEILALIGSKEGIAHAPFALANPGDVILVPSPGYPVYANAAILAGCVPYEMPLVIPPTPLGVRPHPANAGENILRSGTPTKGSDPINFAKGGEGGLMPNFDEVPKNILKKAKLIFLNYPNNPTSAVATKEFFKEAVSFAHKNNLLICHDAAYIEITYDGYKAPSILEIDDAKDVAIEFHSLSKTYNMTGWRLGFAAGNKDALAALGKLKTNFDSSATAFVQHAGAVALTSDQRCVVETCSVYQERRDILVEGLKKLGWKVTLPMATFYVWAEPPHPLPSPTRGEGVVTVPSPLMGEGKGEGDNSKYFTSYLLEKTGIAVAPGIGFGTYGEGFIRFSLTAPTERIEEAVSRLLAGNGVI